MAKNNHFAEKAVMKKMAEQHPPKEAVKIAKTLSQLGFDMPLGKKQVYR